MLSSLFIAEIDLRVPYSYMYVAFIFFKMGAMIWNFEFEICCSVSNSCWGNKIDTSNWKIFKSQTSEWANFLEIKLWILSTFERVDFISFKHSQCWTCKYTVFSMSNAASIPFSNFFLEKKSELNYVYLKISEISEISVVV